MAVLASKAKRAFMPGAVGRKILESRLQAYFIQKCRENGAFAVKTVVAGRRGFPDVLVIFHGSCFFVELKTDLRSPLSAPQQRMAYELSCAGAMVGVLRGKAEVDAWLERKFEVPL